MGARLAELLPPRQETTFKHMDWLKLIAALLPRLLLRPADLIAVIRTAWRFRRRAWFTKPPFLPVPPQEYIRWRMYTAYGTEEAVPTSYELIRFARWATRG
jgi:hypothetical protein